MSRLNDSPSETPSKQATEAVQPVQGSCSSLVQTARGKLQKNRSKINQQIDKQQMLCAGAEKLLHATSNKKMRENISLELTFVHSNLELLKSELYEMNSNIEVYDKSGNTVPHIPMIAFGLKETVKIDYAQAFLNFIEQHYYEKREEYVPSVQQIENLREAARSPSRNESGISSLYQYYNQLFFVEMRFFPNCKSSVHFQWFDSLTGLSSTQTVVSFERASILFNIGALYSQLAAAEDRSMQQGLMASLDYYKRAAGVFHYLLDNFENAPNMDLHPTTLDMLHCLMLAQSQECLFEMQMMNGAPETGEQNFLMSQEAATICQFYQSLQDKMSRDPVKSCIPYAWVSMACVKYEHYHALTHHHTAQALTQFSDYDFGKLAKRLCELHIEDRASSADFVVPRSHDHQLQLGRAHYREAILANQEGIRLHKLCRHGPDPQPMLSILKDGENSAIKLYSEVADDENFTESINVPKIKAKCREKATHILPSFSEHPATDIFLKLGPASVFNCERNWSCPRTVNLRRGNHRGFGFSIRGEAPVMLASIDVDGVAEKSSMKMGDWIVSVLDEDCKFATHEKVVHLLHSCGEHMRLQVASPKIQDDYCPSQNKNCSLPKTSLSTDTVTHSDSISSRTSSSSKKYKRLSWITSCAGNSKNETNS